MKWCGIIQFHSLTHSLTHSLIPYPTHTRTHARAHTHNEPLTHSLTHSLTDSLTPLPRFSPVVCLGHGLGVGLYSPIIHFSFFLAHAPTLVRPDTHTRTGTHTHTHTHTRARTHTHTHTICRWRERNSVQGRVTKPGTHIHRCGESDNIKELGIK